MGCSAGPNIVEDGLVLCLDAGNSKKSYKTDNNLLDLSTWYVGANSTTGVTGFNFNETDSGENTLIADTDPLVILPLYGRHNRLMVLMMEDGILIILMLTIQNYIVFPYG